MPRENEKTLLECECSLFKPFVQAGMSRDSKEMEVLWKLPQQCLYQYVMDKISQVHMALSTTAKPPMH